ncbi:hypothetical protein [Polynucleobacter sp. AP-RePozz3-80-G7]|uniref:hypothetical protein n=1 Tax=Polynucleobacter sp. AP-RePozz3-80-G7 TaxID=2689105 RepID=UPI001C0CAF14|nr:hypothetical protein [Polynucleobacter sp. AP-RePozz3-80-G7]MBU3638195.1 hypothetical protein [Polynucleobacter sp. AP-RePozz3-80-G7]
MLSPFMCLPNATLPQPISVALWSAYGLNRGVPIHFQPIHMYLPTFTHYCATNYYSFANGTVTQGRRFKHLAI